MYNGQREVWSVWRGLRCVYGLLVALCLAAPRIAAAAPMACPTAGAFDFSAMDRLWAIVSVLESDREPASGEWDQLARTPGYTALIAHEPKYGVDYLQRNLRLVFKPSLAGELANAQPSEALRHFLDLKAKKADLQAFQTKVQQPSVWNAAVDLVQAWLPAASTARCPAPVVAFVVFASDARGGYGPLIFDLLYAFDRGESFTELAAHEMFHYYTRELSPYDPGNVPEAYQDVLDALGWLQGEGMADQIDKAAAIETGSLPDTAYYRAYQSQLADSPRIVFALDDLLCQLSDDPRGAKRIGVQMLDGIPMSGHPTGHFMTRAILQNGGKAELVRTFNNPFAFVYLYNAAAIRSATLPRFSNQAIGELRRLEHQVGLRPEDALAKAAVAGGVDWSSVIAFRAVTTALLADHDPDPSLWTALFRTSGYRIFFAHEGDSHAAMQDAISLAFKPSRNPELERVLTGGGTDLVRYFLEHKKFDQAVTQAWEQWQQSGALERTVQQLSTYLPAGASEVLAGSTVTLLHLGTVDLRYGYEALLVDPLWIRGESSDSFTPFIRLNLLSRYAAAVTPYDNAMLTRRQATFLRTWEEIQLRGLADLASRDGGDQERSEAQKSYAARLQDVPQLLARTDAIMKRAATDPAAWRDFESLQRDFFLAQGSPLGYFIASACKDVLGRQALATTTGDPVAFLRLYQRAARRKSGLPPISSESTDWLARLAAEAKAVARNR
ncbi:MAG: DUF5700 domain-containing putative Zn-dependent protease [Gemmatimonadaceae bacterium]